MKKEKAMALLCTSIFFGQLYAADLSQIDFGQNKSGNFEIQILGTDFTGVTSFNMLNPARIVIDIPDGRSKLKQKNQLVNIGYVDDVTVVEGEDRTRVTIGLNAMVAYDVKTTQNNISVAFDNTGSDHNKKHSKDKQGSINKSNDQPIESEVEFSKGREGQGVVTITLPNEEATVSVTREGSKVIAKLNGAQIDKAKQKRLNVGDFGTSVISVDVFSSLIEVKVDEPEYEFISYHTDNKFSIEFSKVVEDKTDLEENITFAKNKKYHGESLSINFQDIEVRSVIQLIADFTQKNMVVSDEVKGSITLKLDNVPWDQALDVILKTKGLSKRESGGVVYIAPTGVLVGQEATELEGLERREKLAPLQTEMIQIQFARAENLKELIVDSSRFGGERGVNYSGFLSGRGNITVDTRTNTLLVQDVGSRIDAIRGLISELDVPVNQVLIDARIVIAADNFAHDLGVQFGGAFIGGLGDATVAGAGSLAGASGMLDSAVANLADSGQIGVVDAPSLGNRLGVSLPSTSPTGRFGIGILGADFMLDLELSASQSEDRSETISSPRVITQDGMEAMIKQGQDIPYTTRDEDGFATVSFKNADLSLSVTPKIAPNRMVDMILKVTKDAQAGTATVVDEEVPIINTNEVNTQVLVKNGETVVLGGVYEQRRQTTETKVPFLGDIPIVGQLFRRDSNSIAKNELLIFVTPKIIDKRFVSNDKFSSLRKEN